MRCWLLVMLSLGCGKGEGDAVGNSPPSTPGIELTPEQPNASDGQKVTVVDASVDPDGDNVEYKASGWSMARWSREPMRSRSTKRSHCGGSAERGRHRL